MSELVNANPIMAQYLPKPTAGFQTFGAVQAAENIQVGQQAGQELGITLQSVAESERSLSQKLAELERKKSEHAQKVQERASVDNEVSRARQELQSAQASFTASQKALQEVAARVQAPQVMDSKNAELDRVAAAAREAEARAMRNIAMANAAQGDNELAAAAARYDMFK